MPPAVQVDLVAQLQSLTTAANEGSVILRRNAMYDLAMCYMTGFGNNAPDANKACDLLLEAAQLGSQKALTIIFRLHLTLRGVAPKLSVGDSVVHPIIEVEKRLTSLPPQKYFSERVRQFEKVFQQEALRQQYDILHKGQLILTGISLYDVDDLLATMQGTEFFLESLECSSQSGEVDLPPVRGLLLHTAVRFGLLSLVRFLLGLAKPLSGETHLSIISSPKQEDLLIAACRGGQLVMLEYLLSEGVELSFQMLGTPLHWLIMFPIDEAKKALDILLTTEIGKACLLIEVPSPRVKMQHFYLTGTPLEWAITVNYKELVELLLAVEFDPKLEKDLPALGWTDSTFRRAVASHLSDLITILLPLELAYLESRPLFDASARYLLSHGESKHLPFGLFDLSHSPNSPLFMALMHGSSSRAAVDASIETILKADICEIDSIDSKALTALAHAVRFAPCTLNTDVISSLISHGATFGNRRPASIILELVAKRSDCVEGPIISLLLESGVLPLTIKVVTAAVQTGNVRILEALLSFVDTSGKKFDVSVPVVEDGLSASLLFFALMSPNHAQTMSLLLDYGADIESQMSNETILETAISLPGCDGEAINMLISRGASLTFLDGFTLIHRAAALKSQVDRLHILYHILKNEKAAEFVNVPVKVSNGSYTKLVWPLQIACLSGNVEAVRALLSAEAKTEVDESSSVLDLAISIGRRPELSPRSDIDLNDEKMVYSWRLNIEEIVMMLLDKTAPGHGRTPLHVAAHLGNYDRIVELVERKGLKVTTMDQGSLRPLDLLEDIVPLENGTETSQSHIENLKRIKRYLSERFIRDVNLTPWGEERMEELLEEISTTTLESAEDIAAKAGFEKTLREMKVDKDRAYLSTLTDGCKSPSEVEAICSELLAEKKQDQDLVDTDPRILRIMEVLFRAYYMQRKYEEAEKIQYGVLIAREAQLKEDDSLLHFTRSDRCRILCVLGRNEEALAYTNDAIIKVLHVFGINNLATLSLQCGLSIIEGIMGNYDKAIELQEKALSVLDERGFKDWKSKRSLWFGTIEVMCNLIFYSCKAEVLDAVNELAEKSASAFEFVLKEEFLEAFELLDHAAMNLQLNKRFEDAEVIYTKAAEICTKNHGRGKSYCVRNALERLSGLYIVQQKWKDAAVVLQQLLNHFTIILDQDHPDKAKCMLRLAIALEKEERYLEASLLQEQAVRSLEQTLGITDPQTLRGKLGLCRNYRRTNQLDKSEIMGRLAMNGFRNLSSGEDDQWTTSAENDLATTLLEENKLEEALEIRQRQVSAMERVHGEVHEKTQNALLLLSQTLMRMDRVEEVLEQSERALQICLKIWGQNSHPLSNCLYIQARCKKKLGDGEEAAKLFARSLEAERVSHGGNNSDTLLTMRVLGKLYSELEEYEKAESLFRELLDEAPKVYGTNDHAEIQLATNYLGYVCEMTDRLDEAIKHYQEAARMARHIHGDSNGETVACLDDLLRAYMDADRMRAARTLAVEVLQWKIKSLGKYHEDTMDTYKAFCIIYPELDMWPEAERVQRLVLRHLQSQSQDADDAEIISTMAAVADSCQHQDRYKEAEKFARQVLKLNIQRNGKEAEETLQAMIRLAYTLADSNQVAEAEKLNNDAYSISLRVFASDHEQAISALSQSAYICYKQEKFEEAEKIQLQVLDLDPDDVTEIEFLQNVYTKMKRFDEALELCQKEISIRQEVWGDEGLGCISILQAMGNMTNLYASLERWSEARENGERVQGSIKKIHIPRNLLHDKVLLDSMTALKPVYEALCEEDKLYELTFQVRSPLPSHVNMSLTQAVQ
jgi:tetratricopeptide (TPR) repeat protein/ankyrin repeat protein